ncbi:site-specific integrase [Qipengyuania aurantiaca]|uniref:Site-specific integrase n=1 Tax=Qipengyuania aurantiaca TaxID=2867233 RepID=A0ABX8ZI03_9SPHN|nr:site-specific integrase [Qipengyuania aurantiaca]QZD88640.1 site-specific integrase [Qipengyuania aurantiaca]
MAAEMLAQYRRELTEEGGGQRAAQIAFKLAKEAGFKGAGGGLARLVQRARIASTEVWQRRLVSDYGARPGDPLFEAALDAPQKPSEGHFEDAQGLTLSDLISAYRAAKWAELKRSTQNTYSRVFDTFLALLGDHTKLAAIDRQKAREFFEAVKAIPKGYGKGKRWEGVTLPAAIEMAKREGLPTLSPKTINSNYMGAVAALFRWAEREDLVAKSPFQSLRVKDPVAAKDKRDPFTLAQLATLFAGEPWASGDTSPSGHPSRYWLPLIALFQGMRRGEIAQLQTAAFRMEDGVHVMDVRGSLKNANAYRTLPVHPELVRLGLLSHVKARKELGMERLFDSGQDAADKWGDKAGDWFGRLVKAHRFEGKGLGLHALRHSFEDALRRAGLHGTPIGAALAGRKGGDPVAGAYGKGFAARQLAEAIAKVSYPGVAVGTEA